MRKTRNKNIVGKAYDLGVLFVLVLVVISGCSTKQQTQVDESIVSIPDSKSLPPGPIPKVEPRSRYGNPSSYVVFGKTYYTLPSSEGYVERGIASWYGKKFHGRPTSSREPYNMYAMTAAHTQLPLPTYVLVTNLKNGKQIIVRVNDRGPFHDNRIIDLSYTAATKLDIVREGTGLVEVRALDPVDYQNMLLPNKSVKNVEKHGPFYTLLSRNGVEFLVFYLHFLQKGRK